MNRSIPTKTRKFVAERADFRCEYCRIHQSDLLIECQIDHIIALKHGGSNRIDNLAFCCFVCNSYKGSDVGTIHPKAQFTRFFNPRTDIWQDHFRLSGPLILSKTQVGEGTLRILKFNSHERVVRREFLLLNGRFPI